MFSWYVGIQGNNQTYNTIDNNNGAGIPTDGSGPDGIFSSDFNPIAGVFTDYGNGPYSTCTANGPPKGAAVNIIPVCNSYAPWAGSGFLGTPLVTQDRENIVNFHFGIPHHGDSGRDDVQALFYNFGYHQEFGGSIDQQGGLGFLNSNLAGWGGPNGYGSEFLPPSDLPYNGEFGPYSNLCGYNAVLFGPNACATTGPSPLRYADTTIFNPGTTFGQSAAGVGSTTYLRRARRNTARRGHLADEPRHHVERRFDHQVAISEEHRFERVRAFARLHVLLRLADVVRQFRGPIRDRLRLP